MRQGIIYNGLKTMENYKTVEPKSDQGRLSEVVGYNKFCYRALTGKILGVLDHWSLRVVVAHGGSTVGAKSTKKTAFPTTATIVNSKKGFILTKAL